MKLTQRKHESGASLIVGLVLLLVATLVVFAGVRGTQMQERMTSNLNNKAISLKAAEAGASDFLAWIQEELDNGGWPDEADLDLPRLPGAAQSSVAVVDGTVSGRYWFDIEEWNPAFLAFVAIGDADGLAESRVRVRINAPGGNPLGGPEPPAAISCLGGNCFISAGQGQSVIDGHNFELPPESCDGRNACYNNVAMADPPFRVPAVYFETSGTAAPGTGATKDCKYTGLPNLTDASTDWSEAGASDGCNNSTFIGNDYPGDENPTSEAYFGEDTIGSLVEGALDGDGKPILGSRDNPLVTYIDEPWKESGGGNYAGILIIDGKNYWDEVVYEEEGASDAELLEAEFAGTTVYEGIILIKNCGKLKMRGTSFVYGAIIIDATGCPTDYDPFGGNGTPNVRYSFEGIGVAGSALGEGTGLRVVFWVDSVL